MNRYFKKLASVLLSVTIIFSSVPIVAVANTKDVYSGNYAEELSELVEKYDAKDGWFAPIYTSNKDVDTVKKDGKTLIDITDLKDNDLNIKITKNVCTIIKDGIKTTLKNNSSSAILSSSKKTLLEKLSSLAIVNSTGAYLSASDLEDFGYNTKKIGSDFVITKDFQTKRLQVDSSFYIPNCGEKARIKTPEGVTVLQFDSEDATKSAYTKLKKLKSIKSVSPDTVYSLCDLTENDFKLDENLSWGSDYIHSSQAKEYVTDNGYTSSLTVAVVDSGVDASSKYLKGRIAGGGTNYTNESNKSGDTSYCDYNGHGTHVSGIIAENSPKNVKILPVKAFTKAGTSTDLIMANSINYAVNSGAKIINMSFTGPYAYANTVLGKSIKSAYLKNVTLVAASGNEGVSVTNSYPACSNECITVASSDASGAASYFSNYGSEVDLAAPGEDILSTYLDKQLAYLSGTSMATPFVVAAAACIKLAHSSYSPSKIKSVLTSSTSEFNNYTSGYGSGILNMTKMFSLNFSSPVIFSKESNSYDGSLTVELTTSDANAKIYYTTNGSTPNSSNGALYSSPITVDKNTRIKARSYENGKYKSAITVATYLFDSNDFEENYLTTEDGIIIRYKGKSKSLTIPSYIDSVKVTAIASETFMDKNLEKVILPDTITKIGSYAFKNNSIDYFYGKNVSYLYNGVFYGNKLSSLTTGKLSSYGTYCFYGCSNFDGSSLNTALTKVPDYAFYGTKTTKIPNSSITKSIGAFAFSNTGITDINLPNAESIDSQAFENCNDLKTINAPNVKTIGSYAFNNCKNLLSFNTPSATTFDNNAFSNCISLTNLFLPDKLATLGSNAFYNCSSVENVNISSSLQKINSGAFGGCSSIKNFYITGGTSFISSYAFENLGTDITKVTGFNTIIERGSYTDTYFKDSDYSKIYGTAVKYNYNDGSGTSIIRMYKPDETLSYLPALQRSGYIFAGWYNGSTKVSSNDLVGSKSITLTAKWTAIKIAKITLSATNATISVGSSKTLTYSYSPKPVANSSVTWSTSNSNVAKVSSAGKITPVAPGVCYIYATAKDGSKVKASCKITVIPKAISGLKLTARKTTSLSFSWNKVSGITGYKIYKYDTSTKTYKYYKTTSKNSINLSSLSGAQDYYFRFYTYKTVGGKNYYSNYCYYRTSTYPYQNKITSLYSTSKAFTVKFTNVSRATSYQIQYSTYKNFKSNVKTVTVKQGTKAKKVSSLSKGKTYYVRIRAIKKDSRGATFNGAYCAAKSIKIK